MNLAERAAVEILTERYPDRAVSLTRRDPGESGPLLVHAGDLAYEVDDQGRVTG